MGRKGRRRKRVSKQETARARFQKEKPDAIKSLSAQKIVPGLPERKEDTPGSERSEPPKEQQARSFAARYWALVLATATLIGAVAGVYALRPIPSIVSPNQIKQDDPMYIDFVLTNQGHIGIDNVAVTCWPAKTVYTNGDTLGVDPMPS